MQPSGTGRVGPRRPATKPAANLDLADFYQRRLKPQEEIAALEAVGNAPASPQERWTAPETRLAWKAWERTLALLNGIALAAGSCTAGICRLGARYPDETGNLRAGTRFELAGKDFPRGNCAD